MLHIIACDDDLEFLNILECKLNQKYHENCTLVKTSNCMMLEEILSKPSSGTHILLMDIELYRENGLDFASKMIEMHQHLKVIFITGYISEYYEGIFLKMRPFGVLSKPVDWNKLWLLLESASEQKNTKLFLPVKVHTGAAQIDPDYICYIESIKRKLVIHTCQKQIECYGSLSRFSALLPSNFLVPHKSFLVNMDYIHAFISREIHMADGAVINVSKSRLPEAKNQYFTYIGMGL